VIANTFAMEGRRAKQLNTVLAVACDELLEPSRVRKRGHLALQAAQNAIPDLGG
jgi:hypothetical protein